MSKTGKHRGHHEGSIGQKADGRWEARITLPNGKRKSFMGKTREEARRKMVAAQRALDEGLAVVREDQTVGQFITRWLEMVRPPQLAPKTWQGYESLLRLHIVPSLGKVKLARLTAQQVQEVYSRTLAEGLSATSVNHLHRCFHEVLEAALQLDAVSRNVLDRGRVRIPRVRTKEIQPLSAADAQTFLDAAAGHPWEALFVVALSTGMRQAELLGLRWGDLDLEHAARPSLQVRQVVQRLKGEWHVKVPKSARSRRRIALTRLAVAALRAHRSRQLASRLELGSAWVDRDLVFPNEIGDYLSASRVYHAHKRLNKAAGVPLVRFHDLRHTCATLLLGRHVNPKIVSEMLGHATVAITLDIYSHVLPDMQQDAAAVLDEVLGRAAGSD